MCLLCVRIIKHKIGKKKFSCKRGYFLWLFLFTVKISLVYNKGGIHNWIKIKMQKYHSWRTKKKHNQVELSSFEKKKVIRTPGMQRLRIKLQVKLDVIRIILFIRGGGWNLRLLGWDRWGASGAAPGVAGGSRRWKATSGGRRWGLRRTRGWGRMGGRK